MIRGMSEPRRPVRMYTPRDEEDVLGHIDHVALMHGDGDDDQSDDGSAMPTATSLVFDGAINSATSYRYSYANTTAFTFASVSTATSTSASPTSCASTSVCSMDSSSDSLDEDMTDDSLVMFNLDAPEFTPAAVRPTARKVASSSPASPIPRLAASVDSSDECLSPSSSSSDIQDIERTNLSTSEIKHALPQWMCTEVCQIKKKTRRGCRGHRRNRKKPLGTQQPQQQQPVTCTADTQKHAHQQTQPRFHTSSMHAPMNTVMYQQRLYTGAPQPRPHVMYTAGQQHMWSA
eukprot:m.122556 g.122556  ORF g.122556 m.122556 type:complete len:290 (-) comp13735_c0_seq1:494-1363(-)